MASRSTATRRLVIDDLRGGRNGTDPPWALAPNQCADAVNVEWWQCRFASKRKGSVAVAPVFTLGGPFNTTINWLFRHVPGTDETAAELWGASLGPIVGRLAAGTLWAEVTFKDVITGNTWDMNAASINGKLGIGYGSAVDRFHYYAGGTVRRAGLAASAAPTAANQGAGAYPIVTRYYRQRSTEQTGGITIRRSEPSPSVSFTPSGAGASARVTQAAVIDEQETHWELEASIDDVTFYRIATIPIGTTFYDDAAVTTTYNTNPLSALTGTYGLQKSYRYVAADQNRVLGLGSFVPTDKQSRVEFSAVIGSLDVGDEERVDQTTNYYIDLDESDSGNGTGIGGPVNGNYLAFKFRQTHLLTPTGQPAQPFMATAISKSVGCIAHRSIVKGEDADGRPALYWMSHRGPYRYGANGLEYLGHGIEDLVFGPTSVIYASTTDGRNAHSVYYPDKRQWWLWFLTSTGVTSGRAALVYDVVAGGWSRNTGAASSMTASAMFADVIGVSMSLNLRPYTAIDTGGATLWNWDIGTDDAGTPFRGYVTTRIIMPGGLGFYGQTGNVLLTAKAAGGVTVSDTITADYGLTTRTATCSLTPAVAETRVIRQLEESALAGDVSAFQHTIGDASASTAAWTIDGVVIPLIGFGPISV